jgi:hypothetical protein
MNVCKVANIQFAFAKYFTGIPCSWRKRMQNIFASSAKCKWHKSMSTPKIRFGYTVQKEQGVRLVSLM